MIPLGPFDLEQPIGRGAMGEVWGGRHRRLGTAVAVKLLTAESARHPRYRAAFRNETRLVAGLDHPNIVHVYDFGEIDAATARSSGGRLAEGVPWLAMERVDGGTLRKVRQVLTWRELKEISHGLLDALAHAHARGVIHRDLQPGNVLLTAPTSPDAPPPHVKLTDFGVALASDVRPEEDEARTLFMGTPAYMAPEQFVGRWRDYGPWTDLYALGCLLWNLCTGSALYGRKSVEDRAVAHLKEPLPTFVSRVALPFGFDAWLARLLEKHPSQRFRRAADAAWALQGLGDPLRAGEVPKKRGRFTPPPMPPTWRDDLEEDRQEDLIGAGLGLFGLRTVPLVDREPDRDALWAALASARADRKPNAVLLRGPSGCGKSRLARWLCERAHEVGAANVVDAHHSQVPGPGHGLAALVSRFVGCIGLDRTGVHDRLSKVLRRWGMQDPGDIDVLTEWIAPASDQDTARGVRPVRFGSATERYVVFLRLLGALGAERQALLWLDDVQWGLDALQFTTWLLREQPPLPVTVVLTAREPDIDRALIERSVLEEILDDPRTTVRPVGPLPPQHRPLLVRKLLGLEPDLARRVVEATAGNPMFAVQLVGDWVERDLLEPAVTGYRLRPGRDLSLPSDLAAVWADRIARVLARHTEKEVLALEIAAVLGREVDPREWRGVSAAAGASASDGIVETLLDLRLASARDGGPASGWSFVHVTLRDALHLRSRDNGRLTTLHALCARYLAAKGTGPDLDERLGRHLLAAGDAPAALAPLLLAIRGKAQAGEYAAADALVALREDALVAAGVSESDPAWADGWLWRFRVATRRGDYAEAERWLDRAGVAAEAHGWPAHTVRVRKERGRLARLRSDFRSAVARLEDLVPDAEALGDPEIRADLNAELAEALSESGELVEADRVARRALKDFTALGDKAGCALCWQILGEIKKLQGAHAEAVKLLKNALDLHEQAGARWGMASACNSLGDVARYRGDHEAAEQWYVRAGGLFRAIGSVSATVPEYNRALALLERGRHGEARPVLTECLAAFTKLGRLSAQADANMALAACAAGANDWDAWDRHFTRATKLGQRTGSSDEDTARLAELLARVTEDAGDPARAQSAWRAALHQWEALDRHAEATAVRVRLGG